MLVQSLLAKHDYGHAGQEIASLVQRYPRDASVTAAAGTLAALKGDPDGARRSFEEALTVDSTNIQALRGLIGHLRARRSKGVDAGEPTGILTHHLVQDEATGTFLRKLAAITGGHRAARWLDATEVFATGVCSLP